MYMDAPHLFYLQMGWAGFSMQPAVGPAYASNLRMCMHMLGQEVAHVQGTMHVMVLMACTHHGPSPAGALRQAALAQQL